MNTKNIIILKNNNSIDNDYVYFVTSKKNIQSGFLHDTYNNYGIPIDSNEACDYCLSNTESPIYEALEEEIREKYNIGDNSEISINYDGTVEIDGEENELISQFAKEYDEKNSYYTPAKYINYFDGSNRQSIVVDCELYDTDFEIVDDDDIINELLPVIEQFDTYIDNGVSKAEEINGYTIGCSRWQDDPWMCYIK